MKASGIPALLLLPLLAAGISCGGSAGTDARLEEGGTIRIYEPEKSAMIEVEPVVRTEAGWKEVLEPEAYKILREEGTERPFSSPLNELKKEGTYRCAACGTALFDSAAKFESGTGWPSFVRPVAPENILTRKDFKLIIPRTEVLCARCGGHLGHVFEDGPEPTGLRYCMNGAALAFDPAQETEGPASS